MQLPNFHYEQKLWKAGVKFVAGLDEVGRGSFAGPVVCGCVVFARGKTNVLRLKTKDSNSKTDNVRIDDSKKLTTKQREIADDWIKKNASGWGVGIGTVNEINKYGIVKAANSGFRRAISQCSSRLNGRVEYLLIDAFYIPRVRHLPKFIKTPYNKLKYTKNSKQCAVINADKKIFSVSAASIIAKVYRDNLMEKLSSNLDYCQYDWGKNKGYGTAKHREMLVKFGPTKHHRKLFVDSYLRSVKHHSR